VSTLHDLKGTYAVLNNALALYERSGNVEHLVEYATHARDRWKAWIDEATPVADERRDAWLKSCESAKFKDAVYVGKGVTKADVERWLREALEAPCNAL
jgi:hypothetical protein